MVQQVKAHQYNNMNLHEFRLLVRKQLWNLAEEDPELSETIKKIKGKFVVYPKKGGKRLGTHSTNSSAVKQLRAIEISKHKRGE